MVRKMRILLVATVFYPQVGGSSRDYYEACNRFPAGEALVLTQKRLAWESEEVKGWREFDREQKFKIYRVRRLRSRIIKTDKKPNIVISLFRLIFNDLPLMAYVLLKFSYLVIKEKIDIVCFENPDYLGWLSLISKYIFRRKSIFFLHGEEIACHYDSRGFAKIRFFYLSKADKLIIFSGEFAKNVLKPYKLDSRATVIRPGLSLDRNVDSKIKNDLKTRFASSGQRVLLTISRLEEHKGIANIIRSIPLVSKKFQNFVYLIGGNGKEEDTLKGLTKELGLEDKIKFLGRIKDEELAAYYDLCDVFVLANIQTKDGVVDGLGVVFIEAGSMGKPVLGGRVGGVPEAVIDGETGILVDGTNVPEISNAIIRLFEDPELAKKLGENGRKMALRSSWDKVAEEFGKACNDLMRNE